MEFVTRTVEKPSRCDCKFQMKLLSTCDLPRFYLTLLLYLGDTYGGGKVDSLKLATAKLQPDAASAALRLMDCLFSPEKMVNSKPS